MMGGVSVNTGTIPSKTLREAVMYLTGMAQREVYGASYRVKSDITMDDLFARTHHVIGREIEVIRAQLLRNHVDILNGTGSFVDAHTLAVTEDGVDAPDARSPGGSSSSRPAPSRTARTPCSSTRAASSTPTACSSSRTCRARSSSSAPGSSASSTRRCSRRWAPA